MAVAKITNETMVDVANTSSGSVGYIPEMSTVSKRWERQGAVKKVKLAELREVTGTTGGYILFSENILLIKDAKIREELGLPELDGYVLTLKEVKDLLLNKGIEELEDMVQNCTSDMLDTITNSAIDLSLSDLNKLKMIEDYSGVDVIKAIKEKEEDTKKSTPATKPVGEKTPKRAPKKKAE